MRHGEIPIGQVSRTEQGQRNAHTNFFIRTDATRRVGELTFYFSQLKLFITRRASQPKRLGSVAQQIMQSFGTLRSIVAQ
jgi:hypothetical protein